MNNFFIMRPTRFHLRIILAILLVFSSAKSVLATTYYVDNISGLDANDGLALGSAWKTLSKATSIASAGDTVNVVNNGPTNPFHERLAPARSGTSTNHIRFAGYNGSPYILGTIDYSHSVSSGWIWVASAVSGEYYLTNNGSNPSITQARMLATSTNSAWSSSGVDALNNRSTGVIGSLAAGQWNWGNNDSLGYSTIYYRPASGESNITDLHIEGGEDGAQHRNPILVAWQYIDIENFKVRFSNHHGILNQTLSNYVSYNNVDSSYTGRSGISNGIFTNMTVTNSRFDHNGMISTVRADYTGIQLSGTTNSIIRNNVISNGNNDSGINIKASSNNNDIANNIIFSNSQHGIDISTTSLNNTISNNTLYDNAEQGINIETNSTCNVIKNNIMSNNRIYQLSIFDSGSTSGLILDNNLFYFTNPSTSMIRYVGSFYTMNTFSTYQSEKNQDTNSLAVNPQFLNSSGNLNIVNDFKLLPISHAINEGSSIGITADYMGSSVPQGSFPDIGAYEFLAPSIPSTLLQYQSDGITILNSGSTSNATSMVIKFTMNSENSSDTITPQLEIQESTIPFTNTATTTGSATAYTGTNLTAEFVVTGLINSKSYHWQVRTSNSAGESGWVSNGGNPDFTVTIASSNSQSNNSTTIDNSQSPVNTYWSCGDPAPVSSPDLFQINIQGTSAILYFSPIANTNHFYLGYSTDANAQAHGAEFELNREGVQNYTVNLLNPNTKYYFKVRGQNGCMPGPWSNIVVATTTQSTLLTQSIFYKNSFNTKSVNTLKNKKTSQSQLIPSLIEHINPTPSPKSTPPLSQNKVEKKDRCYLWGLICI